MSNAEIPLDGLSVEQKIHLMERIWADLSQRPEELPSPAWHGDVLERRRQSVLNGETEFESWDDVKTPSFQSLQMIVRILPAARADLELAADFYESQRQGLGADFLSAIISDIDSLEIHGGIHQMEHGYHRSVSNRFPFAIYYLVESQLVDVYAVIDCRQDPEKTVDRLN